MVGVGLLLAAPPGAPAPITADVQLASTERILPLGPVDPDCLPTGAGCGGALFGPGVFTAAAAAPAVPPMIGPGGWLIGDGLNAADDCTGAACNGGNGGLLWATAATASKAAPAVTAV